jgi:hypothetical protein
MDSDKDLDLRGGQCSVSSFGGSSSLVGGREEVGEGIGGSDFLSSREESEVASSKEVEEGEAEAESPLPVPPPIPDC